MSYNDESIWSGYSKYGLDTYATYVMAVNEPESTCIWMENGRWRQRKHELRMEGDGYVLKHEGGMHGNVCE